jgi:hypothetical protein
MTRSNENPTYTASCHCGSVVCTASADFSSGITCNCSICRRKGHILAFAKPENFTLKTPRNNLTVYTFNTHNIRHQFCKTCGCSPFGEGIGSNGEAMVAINLRCIEEIDLGKIKITEFDGAKLPRAG